MNQKLRARMFCTPAVDVLRIDACMYVTLAHPHVHVLTPGDSPHMSAKKHIGEEKNLFFQWNRIHDFNCVSRSAAVVTLRFYVSGRVHVRNDNRSGVLRLPRAELLTIHGRRERTPCCEIRQQYHLLRRKHRRCLRHEVDSAEDYDICGCLCRLTTQPE